MAQMKSQGKAGIRGLTPNNSSMNLLNDGFDQISLNHEPMNLNPMNPEPLADSNKMHGHASRHGHANSHNRNHPNLYHNPNPTRGVGVPGVGVGNPNPHSNKNIINTLATNCSNNDTSERVAWVSVYMHCECNVNRNKVAFQNISAALAPVKSVFSHDFEGTNTDIQSHLFEEPSAGDANAASSSAKNSQNYQNSTSHQNSKSNVNIKSSGDTDSGVGGISGAGSNTSNSNSNSSNNSKNAPKTDILPKTSLAPDRDSTGICVLQTPPQILVCDLTLKPGEQKKLVYREKIPVEAPPSYSGSLLKYSYKLTVSVQRVGGSIKQIKLPFRVLVLYGLSDYQGVEEMPINSNPFLGEGVKKFFFGFF